MSIAPTPDTVAPLTGPVVRNVAGAVLVGPDGNYLMQLRDERPGLHLSGHWGSFGGAIEPGESADQALRRELVEELEFEAGAAHPLVVSIYAIWPEAPVYRMHFFVVPFTAADLARMVQHEGAGMAAMPLAEILTLERVAPWDLAAILMHARHRALFPEWRMPGWEGRRRRGRDYGGLR